MAPKVPKVSCPECGTAVSPDTRKCPTCGEDPRALRRARAMDGSTPHDRRRAALHQAAVGLFAMSALFLAITMAESRRPGRWKWIGLLGVSFVGGVVCAALSHARRGEPPESP